MGARGWEGRGAYTAAANVLTSERSMKETGICIRTLFCPSSAADCIGSFVQHGAVGSSFRTEK